MEKEFYISLLVPDAPVFQCLRLSISSLILVFLNSLFHSSIPYSLSSKVSVSSSRPIFSTSFLCAFSHSAFSVSFFCSSIIVQQYSIHSLLSTSHSVPCTFPYVPSLFLPLTFLSPFTASNSSLAFSIPHIPSPTRHGTYNSHAHDKNPLISWRQLGEGRREAEWGSRQLARTRSWCWLAAGTLVIKWGAF